MNQRKIGVLLSYLTMGINGLIGLLYVPMLLAFLSQQQYGLYQLVGSMIAYIAIMDFGLSNTTIRYYSRFLAQQDREKQENLLATMLRIYGGISVLILLVGAGLWQVLVPFYAKTLSSADMLTAKYVYAIMLINVAFVIPGHIFSAIIQSHEKFIFLRCATLLNIILQPVLVFVVLHFRANIIALVCVQTLCNFALFLANVYYCLFQLKVRFRLHGWDKPFVKEILFFSFFIFLNAVMDQIYWKSGQLILGALSGTMVVAVYAVAVQLCLSYMNVSANMSGVFLPHLSALAAKGSLTEMNQIFLKVGRLQCYVVMLFFWGFALFGKSFLRLWAGENFLPAYAYTLLLMAALILPLIQNTGIFILQARNKHAFRAIVFALIAVLNVLVAVPLAKHYGAMACAAVTAGCLLLGQGIILNIYYARLGFCIKSFFAQIVRLWLCMLLPVGLMMLVKNVLTWPLCIWSLGAEIVGFSLLYGAAMWFLAMNEYEKNLLKAPFRKIWNR